MAIAHSKLKWRLQRALTVLSAAFLSAAVAVGTPARTVIENQAIFDSQGGAVLSNVTSVTVAAVCGVNLTPTQLFRKVRLGEGLVFAHTLTNVGNADSTYTLRLTPDTNTPGAQLILDSNGNGQPDAGETAVSSVTLAPDASATLLAVGTPGSVQPGAADASAAGNRWLIDVGCQSAGQDGQASGAAPIQQSAADTYAVEALALGIVKTLVGDAQRSSGDSAQYTIEVHNPNPLALHAVSVSDALPAQLAYVSSQPVASGVTAQTVTWTLGDLAGGETRTFTVTVQLRPGIPDDTLVSNTASALSGDLPSAVASAPATLKVFSSRLLLSKSVQEQEAETGDVLHYTLKLVNPASADLHGATISDTPAAGLRFVAGSAQLDGVSVPDPLPTDAGGLVFQVGDVRAQSLHTLTYGLLVTPQAGSDLSNSAAATARGRSDAETARVISNESAVRVPHRARLFGGQADIVGRVYVDHSGSGHYVAGVDTPVALARVVLAGGREALTDSEGRYHFASLLPDRYAVRLDPRSVPWKAESLPGDEALNGSRAVEVWGLTTVDFPLLPNQGGIK